MTTNKAQKHDIRARMAKTGERYAAARHMLLDRDHEPENGAESTPATSGPEAVVAAAAAPDIPVQDAPDAAPDPAPEPLPATAPGMSEAAIRRATGQGWNHWFALLDAWDAPTKGHPAIARHLVEAHGLGGWWAQSVAVGYERARGLRARHQHADGFAFSASRTFPLPVERLSEFVTDETLRDRWLEPGTLRPRTAIPGRSARFDVDVEGGSRLLVALTAKGPAKTTVTLPHEKLPDAAAAETWRAFWKERLTRLGEAIAP